MKKSKILIYSLLCFSLFSSKSISTANNDIPPNKVTEYIQSLNPNLSSHNVDKIFKSVLKFANQFQINPALLLAIIEKESTFNVLALNASSAIGLMQIVPKWHKEKIGNKKLTDIEHNIFVGSLILHECKKKYNHNVKKSLQCYNGSKSLHYANEVLLIKTKYEKILVNYEKQNWI